MSLLAPEDLTGIWDMPVNDLSDSDIQNYLDQYEAEYLRKLLGATLYDELLTDLGGTLTTSAAPTELRFTKIWNAFNIDEGTRSGCIHTSEGIKNMLKGFIYFEWVRDNNVKLTIAGQSKSTYSNSEIARVSEGMAISNYNRALNSYNEIQWYIDKNQDTYDYDDYNGVTIEYIGWL